MATGLGSRRGTFRPSRGRSVLEELNAFFESSTDRAWIEKGQTKVYVRRGPLHFFTANLSSFVLANVVVDDYGNEHTGRLRPVMQWMEQLLADGKVEIIKVEQVMSERMESICRKHGWWTADEFEYDPDGVPTMSGSFWKWRSDSVEPKVHDVLIAHKEGSDAN